MAVAEPIPPVAGGGGGATGVEPRAPAPAAPEPPLALETVIEGAARPFPSSSAAFDLGNECPAAVEPLRRIFRGREAIRAEFKFLAVSYII
jgi:hypothetical protein